MEGVTTDPKAVREVYDDNAEAFDRQRNRSFFEARWLARFGDNLPRGGKVLDLGCGAGEPIAAWLIGEGFRLTGADFSQAMLSIARGRWPEGDWRLADMRNLDLGETFDGIVAWDSFFHLTPDEQRATIPQLARHLAPGGLLLATVGPAEGEVIGQVGGHAVYHSSLSPAEYATLLEAAGMTLTAWMAEDPNCDMHTVLMARRGARRRMD